MSRHGKGGRPPGGGQEAYKQVVSIATVIASECRKCKSSLRRNYSNIRKHVFNDVVTTWKDTYCLLCGQRRTDIFRTKVTDSSNTTAAIPLGDGHDQRDKSN